MASNGRRACMTLHWQRVGLCLLASPSWFRKRHPLQRCQENYVGSTAAARFQSRRER